ncbi:hypothetical protein AB0E59_17910 [Lentzea sp. NPDC034063]|uniref:hypothetical protein n=1 Tax=unclassified Lentzea TaxID=2643253 RepID=UPI0033FF0BB4
MGIHGYTARHRSMLKAVAEGRAELSGGRVPNLAVDGLWCDFTATNELCARGLVAAAHSSQSGQRVRAVLTSSGEQVLGSLIAA